MPMKTKRLAALTAAVLLALFSILSSASASAPEARASLPVIMYHNLSSKVSLLGDYTVSPSEFESDLVWLRDNGYETISLSQLLDFVYNGAALPEKPVMLTFDDSFESFLLMAYPLLEQYGAKAVVNVLGWPAEELSDSDNHNLNYSAMSWEQISSIAGSGLVEFGNHTYDLHNDRGGRTGCRIMRGEDVRTYQTLLKNDLEKLQKYLSIYAGYSPLVFAYPYGAHCAEALPVLKGLGFKAALTCDGHINTLYHGDTEALYYLGRFNRPSGASSESFFAGLGL